jgi:ubiquinone/menaquinone biosynthesis C-methylase UbiE
MRKMLRRQGHEEVMQNFVGGAYEEMGAKERSVLISIGLGGRDYLIDVGCGSGRLAWTLRNLPSLSYLGTDVIPELIKYADERCRRPDWRFTVVENLTIPERDNQADMVVFFSVFTHLSRQECFDYLQEAARVVLPAGRIVVSFLDPRVKSHRSAAGRWALRAANRLRGTALRVTLLSPNEMKLWGDQLGLESRFMGTEAVGQSICVYRKHHASRH